MKVHLLHRNNLRVPAARRAALDAEGGAHGGLADARDALLVQVRAHRLREPDGGGGLALPERRGVDARHHDVVPAPALRLQLGSDLLRELRLEVAVRFVVLLAQPARRGDGADGHGRRALRDVDVRGDGRDEVGELTQRRPLGDLHRGHGHGDGSGHLVRVVWKA